MVIDGLKFDGENPCFVVEGGISHGGDLDALKKMIDAAAMAGAHAYKTQYRLPSEFHPTLEVVRPEIYRSFSTTLMSLKKHMEARDYARSKGLLFGASLFCEEAIDHMDRLKPDYLKIGSGESMHLPFVRKVVEKGQELEIPVVVSTGMCNMDEIAELSKFPVLLMACVSYYPCRAIDNERQLDRLRKLIGGDFELGFSDHSQSGCHDSIGFAHLFGAVMIERHMKCTDTNIDAEVGEDIEGMTAYFNGLYGLRVVYEPTWVSDRSYDKGESINTDKWIRCGYGVRVTRNIKGCKSRVPIERGTPIVNCMIGQPS